MVEIKSAINETADLLDAILDENEVLDVLVTRCGYGRADVEMLRDKLVEWWAELEDGNS